MEIINIVPLAPGYSLGCSRFAAPADDTPVHMRQDYDILLAVSAGIVRGKTDGHDYEATSGQVVFHRANQTYKEWTTADQPLRCYKLVFRWTNAPESLPVVINDDEGLIMQTTRRMFSLWWRESVPQQACLGLLTGIIGELVSSSIDAQPDLVRQVQEHTHNNISHPTTLEELAADFGYNPHYFVRKFSAVAGHGPMAEVRNTRLAHARRLVMETELPVHAIAKRVGIMDPGYLSRLFRRHYNVGIRELRRHSKNFPPDLSPSTVTNGHFWPARTPDNDA